MRTKIFKSGNSKAIRIPASIKIMGNEVEILDLGCKGILITPIETARDPWDLFDEGIAELDGDWPSRIQEVSQSRDDW
jgi:virulence-associated protein VagC